LSFIFYFLFFVKDLSAGNPRERKEKKLAKDRSRGAEEQRSRGAEEQRSRGARQEGQD
jgi:hypothetical protein